jgi:hypothetical protein
MTISRLVGIFSILLIAACAAGLFYFGTFAVGEWLHQDEAVIAKWLGWGLFGGIVGCIFAMLAWMRASRRERGGRGYN